MNAKLVLAGDGPMLPSLYELAKQLGVAESIVPVGALGPAELARWLCASDFALVNSESESFCLAALEAMACGVPVLGTRCGGLEEVVSTVSPDLLSDVGDTDSMADQCVRLISDPDRYHALQERCMAVPHTIYLQDRQENAYVSMFEDLRPAGAAAQLPR
ncbi:MAG: glycosyltransferase [Archangiaceae bacterium]|nr:glycosyltransferase [Archangiaceae bacterium]